MLYEHAKLALAMGKEIRRKEWNKGDALIIIDGTMRKTLSPEVIWECGNTDSTAQDWEIVGENTKKFVKEAEAGTMQAAMENGGFAVGPLSENEKVVGNTSSSEATSTAKKVEGDSKRADSKEDSKKEDKRADSKKEDSKKEDKK